MDGVALGERRELGEQHIRDAVLLREVVNRGCEIRIRIGEDNVISGLANALAGYRAVFV
jgi:hypothetical protein